MPEDLFGHLVAKNNLPIPFHDDVKTAFVNFVIEEVHKYEDEKAEEILKSVMDKPWFDDKIDLSSLFIEEESAPNSRLSVMPQSFSDYFDFVMKNSTSDKLSMIIAKEQKMSEEMSALIRARDFEIERLTRACENAVTDSANHVNTNYANQIQALSERQKAVYKDMIKSLYEKDEIPEDIRTETPPVSVIRNSLSQPELPVRKSDASHESFTIYIGAQMKTMHNARILQCDSLADLCKSTMNDHADSMLFDSRRLQLLMSLYGRELTSVVLLVGRDPLYHVHNRTPFLRMCEQSAELHFDSFEVQLNNIANTVHTVNKERGKSNQVLAYDTLDDKKVPLDEKSDDISSRHACIGGLYNIVQISARCSVRTISLPLFLVESMNENMTVSWCLRRAELIFKCLKGFLMEACSMGMGSAATVGSASTVAHYNVNFALPSKLSKNVYNQIIEMFSTIFHLVPSVSG
uniref:Uncharacterized protein n=1 Tax=Acrobeloides nanus TaxID=290746 RepID=A0A914E4H3_9BILA